MLLEELGEEGHPVHEVGGVCEDYVEGVVFFLEPLEGSSYVHVEVDVVFVA